MNWAIVIDGVVQRISAEKPHPDALPIKRNPPDLCRVANDIAQRDVSDWIVGDGFVEVTYCVTPRDIEAERSAAKQRARDERDARAADGIAFAALLTIMQFDDAEAIDVEIGGEWVTLSQDEAMEKAGQMSRHVQACFAHCRSLHEQINACETIAEIRAIDLTQGEQNDD